MAVTAAQLRVTRGAFRLALDAFFADASGTALVGPNGAGKTTLLLALQGLLPHEGRVERPVACAGVFAHPAVLRGSVIWNVMVVLQSARGVDARAARERAARALDAVGLAGEADGDARRLSAGQRQRLALARALALEPRALLLDEPFANIDADGRFALRRVVGDYVARTGCALVLATQALADVTPLCRYLVLLDRGHAAERLEVAALGDSAHPYLRALLAEGSAAGSPSALGQATDALDQMSARCGAVLSNVSL
jgi:ABC-type multidrug transport system ATPase subunit